MLKTKSVTSQISKKPLEGSRSAIDKDIASGHSGVSADPGIFRQRHMGNWAASETGLDTFDVLRKQYDVSRPTDPGEIEADSVSKQIVSMKEPENGSSQAMNNSVHGVWRTPTISRRVDLGLSESDKADIDIRGSNAKSLDGETASYMEPRFGYDFSDVRVHVGTEASEMASSLNAKAFTVGRDVYFGHGQYSPETREGKELIAHELTHVVQQGEAKLIGTERISKQGEGDEAAGGDASKLSTTKTLTLNITKLEGSTRSTSVTSGSTILENGADIKIVAGTVETLNKAQSEALIGTDLILDEFAAPGAPTEEEKKLTKRNRTAGKITAYFVKAMSAGSHGEAFTPSSFPTINPSVVLKNGDSPFAAGKPLAHELGHMLLDQGGHPSDNTNIMSYSNNGVSITSSQKTTMRGSSYVT